MTIPILIVVLIFVILLQALILFCCAAAGKDPVSQAISDQEQLEFLRTWEERHRHSCTSIWEKNKNHSKNNRTD